MFVGVRGKGGGGKAKYLLKYFVQKSNLTISYAVDMAYSTTGLFIVTTGGWFHSTVIILNRGSMFAFHFPRH